MKKIYFLLTNENIDDCIRSVRAVGEKNRADRRMLVSACLSLEEILINFQTRFTQNQTVCVKIRNLFNNITISVSLLGAPYNPVEIQSAEENGFIISQIGMRPQYSYHNGINQVTLSIHCNKGRNELFVILFSVLIGLLAGVIGNNLPTQILDSCKTISSSVSQAIFGLLKMASLPVVFLCVIYGIISSGSVSGFRENGLKLLRTIFVSMVIFLLLTTAICIPVYKINLSSNATDVKLLDTLTEILFSILPDNIFTPFTNGDTLKVILLGVISGMALLMLGERVSLVNQLVFQLKEAGSLIMSWVGSLIPLLIVVVLADNIWNGSLNSGLLSLWKIVALYFLIIVPILLWMIYSLSRKLKMSFSEVASAVLIPGLKGIASASSMLCYYDMLDGLTNKLNVSESRANFGLPLEIAFYQPLIILYSIFVLFFVGNSGTVIDFSWLVSFLLITFFTSIAAPPVSGGSVTLLALLFSVLGINDPMIAMAYPLFLLMDYPNTGFRVSTMMLQIAMENEKIEKEAASRS